jgi:hypothetical protein
MAFIVGRFTFAILKILLKPVDLSYIVSHQPAISNAKRDPPGEVFLMGEKLRGSKVSEKVLTGI